MKESDLKLFLALDAELFGEDAWDYDGFREAFRRPTTEWYLVKHKNELVAGCFTYIKKNRIEIASIATTTRMQGRGLGKLLMVKTIGRALRLRRRKITLEVRQDNVGAQRLYKSFGFVQTHLISDYYSDGSAAAVMKLDLTTVDRSQFTSKRVREMMRALNAANTPQDSGTKAA
jgi:ribosomal-protein-alanine acetyltransferase